MEELGPGVRKKRTCTEPDLTVGNQMKQMKKEIEQQQNLSKQWKMQQPDFLDGGQGK